MIKKGDIVVGLDIGTSKICAVVGALGEESEIDIVGIGIHPSKGLKKGVVVNIESTVDSIKRAVEELYEVEVAKVTSITSAFQEIKNRAESHWQELKYSGKPVIMVSTATCGRAAGA